MKKIKKQGKIDCLNGLKGIGACIIAFFWHYQHFSPQNGSPFYQLFPGFYELGWLAVELFFMLSGFGMTWGYEEKILCKEITFTDYMLKRIRQLFPMMIITLLVTTMLELIYMAKTGETFVYPNFDLYHFILNMYGLQNGLLETAWSFDSPSWCISVSLCCYALFYIVVRKNDQELSWIYLGIGLLGCALLLSGFNYPVFNSLMARGISCFFIGAFLERLYCSYLKNTGGGYFFLGFLIFSFVMARIYGYGLWGNIQMTVILGIAPMIILSSLLVPWLKKMLEFPVLLWLGKLSFGIYLWHFPVQAFIKIIDIYANLEIDYSKKGIWLLYAASVVCVAFLSERLSIKIRKFIRIKIEKGIS